MRADAEGIVLIKTDPEKTREAAERIKEVSDRVFEISGDYDVVALIQANTVDELNRKVDSIRNASGVLETKTMIKLAAH